MLVPVVLHPGVDSLPLVVPPVAVYLCDARAWTSSSDAVSACVLDGEERRKAARFVNPRDRELYVTAHTALRLVLGDRLGVDPGAVLLDRARCPGCGARHGRPVVRDEKVQFSLSHAGHLAMIALADVTVGIDVERVHTAEAAEEVATTLHPTEQAELAALSAAQRPAAFTRAWTRKEAYLKGLGIGLGRSLDLDYAGTGAEPGRGLEGWRLLDVAAPEGYAAALAIREP